MASSRLERIGTIYSRTRGLIKAKALVWQDRPVWYDLYEAFPPKEEPRYDRPIPNVPLKNIFYEEDKLRALFHRRNKQIGTINMFNANTKTLTMRFIEAYKKLQEQNSAKDVPEEQLYKEAIELLKRERESDLQAIQDEHEQIKLVESFKEAQQQTTRTPQNPLKVADLFKN